MDDLTYQRTLAREAKQMTNPPNLIGMSLFDAVVATEKAHPWWIKYDENHLLVSPVRRVTIHNWTVSTLWMELETEDGQKWQIKSHPFADPARGMPTGYLELERSTA